MYENYIPRPLDTSGVDVSSSTHRSLIQLVAKSVHDDWMKARVQEAKASGMSEADIMSNPIFKPWKDKTRQERAPFLASATQAVKVVEMRFGVDDIMNGYGAASRQKVVDAVAENAHDVQARMRMDAGWTYGAVRDNAAKRHPSLRPFADLPESEKDSHRAIGEKVWDGIQVMAERQREREEFCNGLNLDLDSPEGKALFKFRNRMMKMTPDELLPVVDRAVGEFGKTDDVSALKDFRQEVLDLRAGFQKVFNEHRGQPGYEKSQEGHDRSLKVLMRANDVDLFDLKRLGRSGVGMLRDAFVGILKERGEDPKVIAGISPEDAKRLKAQEMYSRLSQSVGRELKGPKLG